jgi:hypothetical protein
VRDTAIVTRDRYFTGSEDYQGYPLVLVKTGNRNKRAGKIFSFVARKQQVLQIIIIIIVVIVIY